MENGKILNNHISILFYMYERGQISMFIGDSIGETYKEWMPGATVFISSQTGSGKTTFVLRQLLPYVAEQNKRILYLVNRRILKEQMERDILTLPPELAAHITVEVYQTIENKSLNLSKLLKLPIPIGVMNLEKSIL